MVNPENASGGDGGGDDGCGGGGSERIRVKYESKSQYCLLRSPCFKTRGGHISCGLMSMYNALNPSHTTEFQEHREGVFQRG